MWAMAETSEKTTCYRHKDRETGVSCSSCGRPICPDCMTPTPVGMRCPECSRQTTKVKTAATLTSDPQLAYALIAINVVVFVAQAVGGLDGRSGWVYENGLLFGPWVADGDWWRIVSAGFLHAGPLHLALNMYFLYFLGNLLEPAIGKWRFGLLYFVSLVGGSFGALLIDPDAATVGASGAVFGLMGAAILIMRARGIDPMQSGLPLVLGINLAISFVIPNISIGGHVGGLIAGGIAAFLMFELAERRSLPRRPILIACAVMGLAIAVGCVFVADASVA